MRRSPWSSLAVLGLAAAVPAVLTLPESGPPPAAASPAPPEGSPPAPVPTGPSGSRPGDDAVPAPAYPLPPGTEDILRRTAVVRAVERVSPAVVNIATTQLVRRDPFASLFFGGGPVQRAQSLGSGVFVDPEGWILTNSHVVAQGGQIRVKIGASGTTEEEGIVARLVANDPRNDLALLKVDGGPFPFVEMGNSADLMIGEPAIAIGNPFGFSSTVTTGVISALGRVLTLPTGLIDNVTQIDGVVQTDAAIDPGNSGGPLLDIHGRLVAVNTAVFREARSIGFAIPVDRVKQVLARLIDPVKGNTHWYGFECRGGPSGLVVDSVDAGGPAAAAGLRLGDRVVAVNGQAARSVLAVKRRLVEGDGRARLSVRRGAADLVLEFGPGDHPALREARERLGVDLRAFEFEPERAAAVRFAVRTVRESSPADRIGIKEEDVLEAVGGITLASSDAVEQALRAVRPGGTVLLRVARRTASGWRSQEGTAILP